MNRNFRASRWRILSTKYAREEPLSKQSAASRGVTLQCAGREAASKNNSVKLVCERSLEFYVRGDDLATTFRFVVRICGVPERVTKLLLVFTPRPARLLFYESALFPSDILLMPAHNFSRLDQA